MRTGVALFCLALCLSHVRGQGFAPDTTCLAVTTGTNYSTTRFDTASLGCDDCTAYGANKIADPVTGLTCRCQTGFRSSDKRPASSAAALETTNEFEESFECVACAANEATSRNGGSCLACGALTTGALNTVGECECANPLHQLFETVTDKQCRACPSSATWQWFTRPSVDPYTCVSCPDLNQGPGSAPGYVCTCQAGWEPAGSQGCVRADSSSDGVAQLTIYQDLTAAKLADAQKIVYRNVRDSSGQAAPSIKTLLISAAMLGQWQDHAVACIMGFSRQSCQALANMCAFTLYDKSHVACSEFADKATTKFTTSGTNGFDQWPEGMPWLFYINSQGSQATDVKSKVTLYNDDKVSVAPYPEVPWDLQVAKTFVKTDPISIQFPTSVNKLRFMLAKYKVDGTFLGFQELSSQLQLCGAAPALAERFLRFGNNYANKCTLDLNDLAESEAEPVLYELYLVDMDSTLYPVPVKVLNLRNAAGGTPNKKGDDFSEVRDTDSNELTRRFFLFDNWSGRQQASDTRSSVLQFAESITLRVELVAESTEKIYPPMLVIRYGQRVLTQGAIGGCGSTCTLTGSRRYADVSFRTNYVRDLDSLWLAVTILFAITMVFVGIVGIARFMFWQRRNSTQVINWGWLFKALVLFAATASDLLFWLLVGICWYALLFFKGQQTVFFLLPEPDSREEHAFEGMLIFCFIAKMLDVARLIWQQIRADIFFIDWETPRGKVQSSHADEDGQPIPVSCWRKLFVANEWNELQVERLIRVDFTLMSLLFFLQGLSLEYLATEQTSSDDLASDVAPLSPVLRFGVASFFLALIFGFQLVFRQLIYHRFFEDKAREYVDMLTMSNISVFIMDEGRHGFYVHGKSIHQFADASMEEMNVFIANETKNLVKERGLYDGKDTFEVFLTDSFRAHYDSVFREVWARFITQRKEVLPGAQSNNDSNKSRARARGGMGGDAILVPPEVLAANNKLNRFLQLWIENNSKNYKWEEGQPTFLDRLFHIPPQMGRIGATAEHVQMKCIFHDDPNYRFQSCLLMGIEYQLCTFLLLCYTIMDYAVGNTYASIFFTYLVDRFISWARQRWGEINLINKSMVDQRFLI